MASLHHFAAAFIAPSLTLALEMQAGIKTFRAAEKKWWLSCLSQVLNIFFIL